MLMTRHHPVAASVSKRSRATVIVEFTDGILLVGDKSGYVLLPGGGVDQGELPIAAAARELYEETGLLATSLQYLFNHVSQANHHHVFLARAEGIPAAADDAECLIYLAGNAADTPLELSHATRAILVRYQGQ